MKQIIVIMLCTSIAFNSRGQVKIGIHASAIGGITTMHEEDVEVSSGPRIGWKMGPVADIALTDKVSVMMQLNLLSKGGKRSYEPGPGTIYPVVVTTYKLTCLELPVIIVLKKQRYWIGAGPSFGLGISGKSETKSVMQGPGGTQRTSKITTIRFDGRTNSGNDVIHLKPFELSLNLTGAYQFNNGLFVQAVFNRGLTNIDTGNDQWRNTYLGIGVGYFFTKTK